MSRRIRAYFCILLCFLFITVGALLVPAAEDGFTDYSSMSGWPDAPSISSEAAILVELGSGTVLYEKNAEEQLYPASITKILTALIVCENAGLDEKVTFSEEAIHDLEAGAFSYMADTGDVLTVEDCLYAMLLMSSNEAAYALAEHVGTTLQGFAYMMNEKAEELGLKNSHFAVPHGLFKEDHYTCAADMAIIMRAALENENFFEIACAYDHTTAPTDTQPDGYLCRTTHPMRLPGNKYYDSRVVCGKTGYIDKAGNTLVTYASAGELRLVCVVLKGNTRDDTCDDTKKLFDYGFNQFSFQPISSEADLAAMEATVEDTLGRVVRNISFSNDARALIPYNSTDLEIEGRFVVNERSLSGNSAEGEITYYYQDYELGHDHVLIDLLPAADGDTGQSFMEGLIKDLKSDRVMLVLVILILCLFGLLIISICVALINWGVRSSGKKQQGSSKKKAENK